jgi:hypothetical protein
MLYILAIVLMIGGSSFLTWNVTSTYYQAKEARVVAEGIADEATKRADIATKMAALEREKAIVREVEVVKWRTVKKEVERVVKSDPVYVSLECRVTDDGVRVYNAAAGGLQLAVADVRPAPVPEKPAAAETRRNDGRPAGDSGSGIRPISRVPIVP